MILASGSPRRAAILDALGVAFEVRPAEIEEIALPGEPPVAHAARLSRAKAEVVARRSPRDWVLGGDTVVSVDGVILGKPESADHAVEMLLRLQGRSHEVVSALTLVSPGGKASAVSTDLEVTSVVFRPFGREHARAYADTGEGLDKAGAYAIQGRGAALVERIDGDYSAVVGLPIPALVRLLERAGRPYRFRPDRG